MATFDAKRLSTLDRVVAAAAAVGLVSLFLPWYGASTAGFSVSVSGWSTSYGWFGAVLMVGAGVYLLLARADVELPKGRVGPAFVVLGASALGTVIVILRWLTLPRGHGGITGVITYSYGPRLGIVVALLVGIVQVICALSLFRASGEKTPWS